MPLTAGRFQTERPDILTLALGDPAAGAERVWNPPANHIHRIVSVRLDFATAVAAANRLVVILRDAAGDRNYASLAPVVQVASATCSYEFTTGAAPVDLGAAVGVATVGAPLGDDFYLKPATDLVVSVINIQAADAITNIVICYLDWLED